MQVPEPDSPGSASQRADTELRDSLRRYRQCVLLTRKACVAGRGQLEAIRAEENAYSAVVALAMAYGRPKPDPRKPIFIGLNPGGPLT